MGQMGRVTVFAGINGDWRIPYVVGITLNLMEEVAMASRTNREQSRQRLDSIYFALREKLIPADESIPLQGGKFIDWENQADQIERELCTAFMEERAALEANSQVNGGGRCPHCSSDRVYLMKEESKVEVRSPHGSVVLHKQRCRCRACNRTFSPSGAGLGPAERGGTESPCCGAGGTRSGDANV